VLVPGRGGAVALAAHLKAVENGNLGHGAALWHRAANPASLAL
jgi:hypothetical protein